MKLVEISEAPMETLAENLAHIIQEWWHLVGSEIIPERAIFILFHWCSFLWINVQQRLSDLGVKAQLSRVTWALKTLKFH